MTDREPSRTPVLLYGGRKSGTTLLQSLLDGGAELFVYPNEIKLKFLTRRIWSSRRHMVIDYLTHSQDGLKAPFALAAEDARPWDQAGPAGQEWPQVHPGAAPQVRVGSLPERLVDSVMDVEKYLQGWEEAREARFDTLADVLRFDVLNLHTSTSGGPPLVRGWAFKEVGGDAESVLGSFSSFFPDGRIVVISRDPYFAVRSVIRDRQRRAVPQDWKNVVRQVFDAFSKIDAYSRIGTSPALHFIRYEDLVGPEREQHLSRMASFLGVRPASFLERPTTLGHEVVVGTSSRNTKRIFDPQEVPWAEGLTARNVAMIKAAAVAYRRVARFRGQEPVSYTAFSQRLRASSPPQR